MKILCYFPYLNCIFGIVLCYVVKQLMKKNTLRSSYVGTVHYINLNEKLTVIIITKLCINIFTKKCQSDIKFINWCINSVFLKLINFQCVVIGVK